MTVARHGFATMYDWLGNMDTFERTRPHNKVASRQKAREVALFIRGYYNVHGHDPTYRAIAYAFDKGITWVWRYKRLAFEYDYLETRKEFN